MKKILFAAVIMLSALTAQAQKSVTINPTLKVGMQKTYTTRGEATSPGQAAADATGELTYKVVGKTADGFQIDMVSKASNVDMSQMLQNMNATNIMQLLNSMKVEVLTDKKGALTGIKNSEELIGKCKMLVDSIFNTAISQNSEMKNNEMMKSFMQKTVTTITDMFTEDYLLETFRQTPSAIALNGKTITEGMVEEGKFAQMLKTKTTYSILNGGKTIVLDTKADVDKPSMKAYMLKMMSNLMPESVTQETNPEQLSEMIDGLISNGTLKIDMNSKATYDIGDDGWVKKMVMEMEMTAPGQSTKARQVFTEKE